MNTKLLKTATAPILIPDQISRALTEAIIDGVLQPGERLVEQELQKHFHVSRSPIREAFRDLEKRGLVEIRPRKGVFVKTVTQKDIDEYFPVLAVLEGLAAQEASNQITSEDLDKMAAELHNMALAAEKKDAKNFREHHYMFHRAYIEASQNTLLGNMLSNLRMHILWYRFSYRYHLEDFEHSMNIHRRIFDLFTDKSSPEDIQKFVRDHVEEGHRKFIEYLETSVDSQIANTSVR